MRIIRNHLPPAEFVDSYEIAKSIRGIEDGINRMFLPLSEMNGVYMEENGLATRQADLKVFLEYVNHNFSDSGYATIQSAHLSATALRYLKEQDWPSPEIKYLDFPFWAASKHAVATRLDLQKTSGLRILDLGSGPGHFGVLCNYLGHEYLGLDIPMPPTLPGTSRHLYDDLCGFFRARRVPGCVQAGVPLGLDERFDVITVLMGIFNIVWDGKVVRPWNWEEWRFFLDDLLTNHARPDVRMYFQIRRENMPLDVWSKLESLAAEAIPAAVVLMFDSSLFERLRNV